MLMATGASFLFLALVFIPMEKVFPAKESQKILRKKWILDLCYFIGQYLLWNGLVLWILNYFSAWLYNIIPGNFRQIVSEQSIWLQATEVIVFSDMLI